MVSVEIFIMLETFKLQFICFIAPTTQKSMGYVSLIVLTFLLAKVGGAKSQCTITKVCGALDNVLQRQDQIGKKVRAILGSSCSEAGKFHECL